MKLTGELKNKVEMAESIEEKKQLIEKAGMELTEEELNSITGGAMSPRVITLHCPTGYESTKKPIKK